MDGCTNSRFHQIDDKMHNSFYPERPCYHLSGRSVTGNCFFCRIHNDFSFDDAVGNTFGCTVRSFDPRQVGV